MTSSILRLCALAALLGAGTAPALAHAHLASEVPAADGTAPSPEVLTLRFTEGLEPTFTGLVLTGPNGAAVATRAARLAPNDPATLIVPLTDKLAPGAYKVEWHAVAVDGHKTSGSYGFTVAP